MPQNVCFVPLIDTDEGFQELYRGNGADRRDYPQFDYGEIDNAFIGYMDT